MGEFFNLVLHLRFRCPVFYMWRMPVWTLVLAVSGLLAGCGGGANSGHNTPSPTQSAPVITFSAQPSTITSGESSVLSWSTSNTDSVSISGLGEFSANGSTSVTPTATTTYTATATGAGGTTQASTTVTVTTQQGVLPTFGHVFLLVEENHSFSSVIGNSSMPYLNSLASKYGLATNYFADTHPSIGDYFELTTGQIITNDDGFTGTVDADNVVRHLIATGISWKSYAESLPGVGYTGGNVYPYLKRHNPFSYFTDVVDSQTEAANLVPFTQFASDLANGQMPSYAFIVPNALNDAHDGSLAQADQWLQTNIAPLIASPLFLKDGLLVIVFDESFDSDTQHGGGQVPAVIISPLVKPSYRSTTMYQHQSVCRVLMQGLGIETFPGECAAAPTMEEFFQ